jgi:hypothetical protein
MLALQHCQTIILGSYCILSVAQALHVNLLNLKFGKLNFEFLCKIVPVLEVFREVRVGTEFALDFRTHFL